MIEPEVTAVLGRRYVAFLIDLSLVAAAGLGVAYQQSTAFNIVGRDSSDSPLVDPAEFDEMSTLLDFDLFGRSEIFGVSVVRAQEIGDSVRVFGGDSYRLGAIAALLAALVVFLIIPAFIERTLGMLPFNLEIRDREGGRAGVVAHLTRTMLGAVDLLPIVIPGLFGMILAGSSPLHQRFGDRVAGTVVVDRTTRSFRARSTDDHPVSLDLRPADEELITEPVEPAFDVVDPDRGSSEFADLAGPDRGQGGRAATGLTIADGPVPAPAVDETLTTNEPSLSSETTPSIATNEWEGNAEPTDSHGDDTLPDDVVLPPPPIHRRQPASDEVDASAATGAVVDEAQAPSESHEEAESPAPPADLSPSPSPSPESWDTPRSEPAPVWQPAPLDPGPLEALDRHDGRTLDDVELDGIGDLITADALSSPSSPVGDDSTHMDSQHQATDSPGQDQSRPPVWSDKWRAWMYWDVSKKCWLRHDTETNLWVPID